MYQLVDGARAHLPATFLWDLCSDTVVMSDAAYSLYRLSRPDRHSPACSFTRLREQVVEDDLPRWDLLVRRARKSGEPFVYQHRIVVGERVRTVVVSASPLCVPGPHVSHLAATAIDLTDSSRGPSLTGQRNLDDLEHQVGNLRQALESRDLIGQAKGILMSRHHLTAEQAFAMLVAASQHTNAKLVQVAADVAETGDLDVRRAGRAVTADRG